MSSDLGPHVIPAEWATVDARPADIRFRPGQGGEMRPEWMAYAVNLWWAAGDKKLTFGEAVKQTAVHFMVGEQQLCTSRSSTTAGNGAA